MGAWVRVSSLPVVRDEESDDGHLHQALHLDDPVHAHYMLILVGEIRWSRVVPPSWQPY
jgi:hypothetical protein